MLAARWRRAVAGLLDGVVLIPASFLLQFAVYWAFTSVIGLEWRLSADASRWGQPVQYALGVVLLAGMLPGTFYEIFFVARSGQTPGRMAMRIQVVCCFCGEKPSVNKAALRWAALVWLPLIPTALYFAGLPYGPAEMWCILLWIPIALAFVDPLRRTLHDMIARTLVVNRDWRARAAANASEGGPAA